MAPATLRRAPYKDFLQPALHRRFSSTATIIFAIAALQAIFVLGTWNSFLWSWFPIGPAGFRTSGIFISGILILVLRIAQYHVGLRTSNSGLQTFLQYTPKLQTLETFFSYTLSAWIFSVVFLWSVPESAGLRWINYFNGDRARLNERPLLLTVHLLILAVIMACAHLWMDFDHLSLGVARRRKDDPGSGANDTSKPNGDVRALLKRFLDQVPSILLHSGAVGIGSVVIAWAIYALLLRSVAWSIALSMFRPFYSLPRYNILPLSLPYTLWLLLRCGEATLLLVSIWLAGHNAFSIFLVREPIKNGKPLTSDSKDPNGSLLNGLKSKKLAIKCFSMWELAFIAREYEDRRKAIYEDIDRKDGPMWSQTYAICLEVLKEIEARIDNYGKAPAPPPAAPAPAKPQETKREVPPLKTDPILVSTPTRKSFRGEVEKAIVQVATDPNQPSRLSPVGKARGEVKQRLLAVKQQLSGPEQVDDPLQNKVRAILRSILGRPFRQEFSRRLVAAVFGAPYGEPSLYINAADALSQLAVRSLQEDKYGNVQRDVANIIRTFTMVTRKLVDFRDGFPFHWTDVNKQRLSPEVDSVLEALRDGLSELVLNFGPYSRDLRLSLTDMRLAREAIGVPAVSSSSSSAAPSVASSQQREMEQVR